MCNLRFLLSCVPSMLLAVACSGAASSSPAPATVNATAEGTVDREGVEAVEVSLADDPNLRFLPASTRSVLRLDLAYLRTTTFEEELLERFAPYLADDEILGEVMADVDQVLIGKGEESALMVMTGDLAPHVESVATVLVQQRGGTREDRDGRLIVDSGRAAFGVVDDHTWLFAVGGADVIDFDRSAPPVGLSTEPFTRVARRVASAGAGSRPVMEQFIAGEDGWLEDITLMLRFGCTECDEALLFDAVIGYPGEREATGHAEQLGRSLEDLRSSAEEESDMDFGLDPEDSWIRVQGTDVDMHQTIGKVRLAFHDAPAMIFILSVSMHPPNMGL